MGYGELPVNLGQYKIECNEMMFYQYLPIKMIGRSYTTYEKRLHPFGDIIRVISDNFIGEFGLGKFVSSYMYLTVKHMYQPPGTYFNREGYHTDGFMTDDINYIWCDTDPTTFNTTKFNLTMDDRISMREMEEQALVENEVKYPVNTLLRLDQYNVHKVSESNELTLRTFLKVSFSVDKYDLVGNSKNYNIDYNWVMKNRKTERNIPQTNLKNE